MFPWGDFSMKGLQKTSQATFKEEFKRILIFYALIPVALCSLVFVIILALFWHLNLSRTGSEVGGAVADNFEHLITGYLEGATRFSEEIDIERFERDRSYAAEVAQQIYTFLAKQPIRWDFYLLDRDGSLVFSTARRNVFADRFRWSSIRQLDLDMTGSTVLMFNYTYDGRFLSELQVGASTLDGNPLSGYAIFAIPTTDINEQLISPLRMPVIVTNRFHRIVLGEAFEFYNESGKLNSDLRYRSGYVWFNDTPYHISFHGVLNDSFFVYTIQESVGIVNTVLLITLLVIIIVVSITITILLSANRVSAKKTYVVDEIVEAFKNVEKGDLHSRLNINSNNEFAVIANSYNIMVDSLSSLIERNRQQAQDAVLSRIKQLESQFNPHFLFNSLENVRFMMRSNPQAADEMIICLSRLMRYSISNSELVTLCEEMEYTSDYLKILNYRFANRFKCSLDCPEELGDITIPPLVLQPIIENSVKHGMQGRNEICVQITVFLKDGQLYIEISDDGAGMSEKRLYQVREELMSSKTDIDHIGIRNVHQRIQLIYGAEYGLTIESMYDRGTTVRFNLPFDETRDADVDRT